MSILIGLHIARALNREPKVTDKVGDRIFPLVERQGVERFPYIMYDTNGGIGETTKDGAVCDVATVGIAVIAKSYAEALTIGNAVRYALDGYCPVYDEFKVCSTGNIVYNDEFYGDLDAFSLNLSIDFKTVDF